MKRTTLLMIALAVLTITYSHAQKLTTPPDGGNKKATVAERIGITDVTIHYDRPGVKGRDGKIWGGLVHTGFTDLGFGTSKAAPWRAGANENTTFTFSTDVMIEGKPLAKGTYGFFIAMGNGDATLIFSSNSTSWGSFFYDEKEDALRVTVKTVPLTQSVERLRYEFMDETENSAVVALEWEKLKIPFTIAVDYIKTQLESFRRELRSDEGFGPDAWVEAANFCVENNTNLEEALAWSTYAIEGVFVGQKNFKTLSCKAGVLNKLNRNAEADTLMKQALPLGTMQELHAYGRQLLRQKKNKQALEVFKVNAQKNPNVFTTDMGLVRGYSANGDFKNALKYAKLAQPLAPDKGNKDALEKYIPMLEKGQDINQ
ncbi:MAG: DUF2911 domain-containing protein [Bacteroidetes bacterium]|nr:DUF2911 domain-containing protein [Bacteroidota bacterium]